MDFIGIGIWEVLAVLVIALMVVGPRRLPEVGRKLGKAVRKYRLIASEMTREITEEMDRDLDSIRRETSLDLSEPDPSTTPVTPSSDEEKPSP